jgi:flagellar basal body-associated protein FliL
MDEKEKKGPAPAEGGESPKAAKKPFDPKILFMAILAGAVVCNVIISVVMINITKPKEEKAKTVQADTLAQSEEGAKAGEHGAAKSGGGELGEPIPDPVDAIVNIAGTNGDRFLKVSLLLCYDAKKYPKMLEGGGEGKAGLGPKKAVMKDMLIELISPMTLNELAEPESREKIRKDFLKKANSTMESTVGEFTNVLVDQFIIQ